MESEKTEMTRANEQEKKNQRKGMSYNGLVTIYIISRGPQNIVHKKTHDRDTETEGKQEHKPYNFPLKNDLIPKHNFCSGPDWEEEAGTIIGAGKGKGCHPSVAENPIPCEFMGTSHMSHGGAISVNRQYIH
jgi:hypothetical protein